MEEEEGFEAPRALTPLSVFKTDPFNQTWVFLHATFINIHHFFFKVTGFYIKVCVKLFSEPFSPQYFEYSIFVRFFGYLPRECLRLVPRHFKLRSKTKNLT